MLLAIQASTATSLSSCSHAAPSVFRNISAIVRGVTASSANLVCPLHFGVSAQGLDTRLFDLILAQFRSQIRFLENRTISKVRQLNCLPSWIISLFLRGTWWRDPQGKSSMSQLFGLGPLPTSRALAHNCYFFMGQNTDPLLQL